MAPIRSWGIKGERLKGFAPAGRWRTLHLPCRPPSRCAHRALRRRWPDQRHHLPRLRRAVPAAGTSPWRHCRPRQPRKPSRASHTQRHPRSRRQVGVPAALLAQLNPIEQVFAKVRHWLRMAQARAIDAIRMRQLLPQCRVRFRLTLKGSSRTSRCSPRSAASSVCDTTETEHPNSHLQAPDEATNASLRVFGLSATTPSVLIIVSGSAHIQC